MHDLYDEEREQILLLVLREAAGEDVADALNQFPMEARSKFRTIVCEAQMVKTAKLERADGGEVVFSGPTTLTPRGRKRLDELNRQQASEGTNGAELVDDDD